MAKPKLPDKNFSWTAKLAYIVGLLVTDGCLSNDGRHIIMRSSEIKLLNTFKKCLNINNKIGKTRNGDIVSYRVQFGDVQFYRWLLKIGLFPTKSYTIGKINIPNKHFRDFLRGHLDGDGNIQSYIDKYNSYRGRNYTANRLFVRFISASKTHINWLYKKIQNIVHIKGALIINKPKKINNVPIWEIKFAKKESIKLLKWIYYRENLPCLKRKRDIAEKSLKIILKEKRRKYTRISN